MAREPPQSARGAKVKAIKPIIDLLMILLMLVCFAYQLTGNAAHEIVGVALFALFAIHHLLNRRWFAVLFKGGYNARRIISTAVNFLMLGVMVLLAISAVIMSRDVFDFQIRSGLDTRGFHTMAASWGLILMSVHLGLHWHTVVAAVMERKTPVIKSRRALCAIVPKMLAALIAVWGIRSSFVVGIGARLLMRETFSYWDFENAAPQFFMAYLSIIGLYAALVYYTLKLIGGAK